MKYPWIDEYLMARRSVTRIMAAAPMPLLRDAIRMVSAS